MQTRPAILQRTALLPVGAPNQSGSAPGTDASPQRAIQKSSTAAARLIVSANAARNHAGSSRNSSETMVISLVEAGGHLVSQPPTPWAVPLSVIRSPCALFGRMANHYLDDDCGMLDEKSAIAVVKVEADPETVDREVACRACGGPLSGREGRYVIKYFMLRKGGRIQWWPRA
jgi:hypothetical protein